MKKRNLIFKGLAIFAFVSACLINFKTVVKNNGKIDSSISLSTTQGIMNAEAENCESYSWKNNGDCEASSMGENCDESWAFHDCWY